MSEQIPSGNHETLYPQSAVDAYASASLHNNPLLYPGEQPDASFMTDGQFVSTLVAKNIDGNLEVQMHTPDGVRPVNDFLAENGAAPLEDRIPLIGYGSNLCPGSLRKKFEKIGRPDALIVPTLYTELSGADVVWSAGPGVNGNFIAGLYAGSEVADTSVRVGLNMLTREQLLVMHATELNYNLRRIELQIDGVKFPAYFYSGGEVLLEDGQPVAVKGTSAKGRALPEATTSDVLKRMLGNQVFQEKIAEYIGDGAVLPTTPEAFVAYVALLKSTATDKQPKLRLKNDLQAAYDSADLARASQLANSQLVSWANPSTIPTFGESQRGLSHREVYLLPHQEIPVGTWPDTEARQKALGGVGAHFVRQSGLEES